MNFPTKYQDILDRLAEIDAVAYGRTRNFIDGAVTRLSPYISRGVLSTKSVMEHVLNQGHSPYKIEKFLQELAWRDYWQQVWLEKGDEINHDLKREQPDVQNNKMPNSIIVGNTGIEAIDQAIQQYYKSGYLHNHIRMYIASIACNLGKSHWKTPAGWMYYHLIDGDLASNTLSWQWVAGANANKKYYANQSNVNKYCYTKQSDTFLDVSYDTLERMDIPKELVELTTPELITSLPEKKHLQLDSGKPTHIYNYYNLDPTWRAEEQANKILLLEPSIFNRYPISSTAIKFMLDLAINITDIKIFVGEFQELKKETGNSEVFFKEHPLNFNYEGNEDPRDWMFTVKGYYPSFFAFWKKCRKELSE